MNSPAPVRVVIGMPFGTALGGAERHLQLVLRRARAHGLEPHLVLLEDGPLEQWAREADVPVDVLPVGRFREVGTGGRVVLELRRVLRRVQPDVVFGWLPNAQVFLSPAARLAGIPSSRVAWWQHHLPTGDVLERLATALPAAAVVCASHAVSEAQARLLPRRPRLLVRVAVEDPPPVDDRRVAEVRGALGISAGRAVIGIPGRLVRWKRQDAVLRAAAQLRDGGADVHVLVVGGEGHGLDLGYGQELRELARNLDLADRVTFTGHVDDVASHVRAMDVLVNASVGEPFGMTVVEAQALGVPALAVGVAGPTETIVHGRSGWLVGDGRPETLASGLRQVLADTELRSRLAAGGRASYLATYTADAGVERFARALRDLAGPR